MNPLLFAGDVMSKWVPGALLFLLQATGATMSAPFSGVSAPVDASQSGAYLGQLGVQGGYNYLFNDWSAFVAVSTFASLVFAAITIYSTLRLLQVRAFERKRFEAVAHTVAAQDVSRTQLRWNRVLEQMTSDSEQSWRLSILEADIMLNELLDSLGYRGETMADKMRQVERADFNTIDIAWEAHRARNKIAHEGSSTSLSSREARRIVGLYESMFREFHFVE